jgi:hypothetical protein
MTIDRALLLYLLHLAEPYGFLGDVKLQQLAFLCELHMFDKGIRGLHFEFFRYAYGAFSKDLDNDLMSLRRKERVENFTPSDRAEAVLTLLPEAIEDAETNKRVLEMIEAVIGRYGPLDSGAITQSVEAVEISSPDQPELKLTIGSVSFHSTLLVPGRIEVKSEFTVPPPLLAKLNTALGY